MSIYYPFFSISVVLVNLLSYGSKTTDKHEQTTGWPKKYGRVKQFSLEMPETTAAVPAFFSIQPCVCSQVRVGVPTRCYLTPLCDSLKSQIGKKKKVLLCLCVCVCVTRSLRKYKMENDQSLSFAHLFFVSSCWPMRDNIGSSTVNLPQVVPRVVQTTSSYIAQLVTTS